MKMYPDDWPFRLTTGVTTALCIAAAMLLEPVAGIHGFWPHMLAVVVAIIVGNMLGRLVYRLLFRPSSGDLLDRPPQA